MLTDTYRTPVEGNLTLDSSNFPKEVSLKAYRCRMPSDHFPVKIKVAL